MSLATSQMLNSYLEVVAISWATHGKWTAALDDWSQEKGCRRASKHVEQPECGHTWCVARTTWESI